MQYFRGLNHKIQTFFLSSYADTQISFWSVLSDGGCKYPDIALEPDKTVKR